MGRQLGMVKARKCAGKLLPGDGPKDCSDPDDDPEKETASEDPEKDLPPSSDIEYIY